MTLELDLRSAGGDEVRDRIFEGLEESDHGDDVEIVAADGVEPSLLRYQIEREVQLDRDYAETGPDVWELTVAIAGVLDENERAAFDARHLPPQQRHSALTQAFDELAPEEGFVLVNDHDPKPLYYELRSMHGDVLEWTYDAEGGSEWRVEIVRTGASEASAEDVVTRFDVRQIPKRERHPTIHHRYGMIPEGSTLELIAPHEPRPLQREFRGRYGDAFDWEIVEQEPGRCRVQITKTDADGSAGDAAAEPEAAAAHDGTGHHCGSGAATAESDGGPTAEATTSADGSRIADATPSADATDASAADPSASESGDALEVTEELDVRDRPPAQRHEAIFEAYADLDAGEGFVLVNDHDPKPLYHQFDAEAGPAFRWEYRARDPGEFRVLIGKAETDAQADADDASSEAPF